MEKYKFLLSALPNFGNRQWPDTLSRGKRTQLARFMLSQHRLPIEKGRCTDKVWHVAVVGAHGIAVFTVRQEARVRV